MSVDPVQFNDNQFPLLPLRDVVVFPHMVIPLFVGRPKSIRALEIATEGGKNILLVAQKSAAKDEPGHEDLYTIGSLASILQMLKLPDGTVKVLVEGTQRASIQDIIDDGNFFFANATPLTVAKEETHEIEAMRRAAKFSIARHRMESGVKISAARLELERRADQWWARRLGEMREEEACDGRP